MKKIIIAFLPVIFLALPALGNMDISGKIVDENGDPLTGATIVASTDGTKGGTTDTDGNFTIKNFPDNAKVNISFLGYTGQELSPSANMGTIKLKEDSVTADDVVVKPEDGQTCKLQEGAEKATTQDGKCVIQKCKDGYNHNKEKNTCEKKAENSKPATDDKNTTSKENDTNKKNSTKSDEKNSSEPSKDANAKKSEPELTDQQKADKLNDLRENYNNMKAKEQSIAARTTAATAIGGMGTGLEKTMQATAEQDADKQAEQSMKAYLETFRCDFGQGRNIKGGEKNQELPTSKTLPSIKSEYVNLAQSLKDMKASLEMTPGIESELILNAADTGLYDDVSLGKISGAYASVSRALMDPESDDAKAWAAQKAETAQTLKPGKTALGVGAAVGLAGNVLIETLDKRKERSAEINLKYERMKKFAEEQEVEQSKLPDAAKCSDAPGATGTYPDCKCTDSSKHFSTGQGCVSCPVSGQIHDAQNGCHCPSEKPVIDNGKCIAQKPSCNKTGLLASGTCECAANAVEENGECKCNRAAGYVLNAAGTACEKVEMPPAATPAVAETKPNIIDTIKDSIQNDTKEEKPAEKETVFNFNYDSDKLFAFGQSSLNSAEAEKFIENFNNKLTEALKADGIEDINKIEYCATVEGHTDKSGGDAVNIKLSKSRAETIKSLLSQNGVPLNSANVRSYGVGSIECDKLYDKSCRKVTLIIDTGTCQTPKN